MAYSYGTYGIAQYSEDITKDDSSTAVVTVDLMDYLPDYWKNITDMKLIQEINSQEINNVRTALSDILNQCFVKTATWGLDLWEKQLKLDTDSSKSYAFRREIILSKLRWAGTTTKAMIKSVASSFSGADVEVVEYPRENRFEIKFVGMKGIPPNISGLIKALETIKPAHLAYGFKYVYTWWESIADRSWGGLKALTWETLRTYEGE